MNEGEMAPETPDEPRKKPSPAKAALGRLTLAHFIAYPVGMVAAIGSMPIGMVIRKRALYAASGGATSSIVKDVARDLKLDPIEAAQVQIVLEFSLWVALAVLLVIHVAAVPWAIGAAKSAKDPDNPAPARRGLRIFAAVTVVTSMLLVLTSLAGWIWVLTL
jgi:hypothetical protein